MTVVAIMTTPGRNEVRVTRVIPPDITGLKEPIYFGWLNGEPVEVPASKAKIRLEER